MGHKKIYIFGTGPSINDITEEEWKFLETQHTMSMSTFPFSGKKTKAYYSHERVKIDSYMINILADYGYFDTKLFISHPESIQLAKSLGFKYIQPIIKGTALFHGRPWFIDENEPPYTFLETRASTFHDTIFRYRGQLSGAINVALILQTNEIRLIGVDLNSSRSFWESEDTIKRWITNPKYLEIAKILYDEGTVDIQKKMNTNPVMKDFNENIMHVTEIPYSNPKIFKDKQLRKMSDILQWMDRELIREGKAGIFNCSKASLLNKDQKLRYKSIMEE